jgi:hypothetical protein
VPLGVLIPGGALVSAITALVVKAFAITALAGLPQSGQTSRTGTAPGTSRGNVYGQYVVG